MNRSIFTENFLLQNEKAGILYHEYAAGLPVIDYHSHLPPDEIAIDKKFKTLTQIWLRGDHYKWRAMRALGVTEQFITGNSSDEEKFSVWAGCVPQTIRNPLFHWTHMELKNPFGIDKYLDDNSALSIYENCNELLQRDDFSTKNLLRRFKVEMVGTTDDPCDDLRYHKKICDDSFEIKVLPTFRPDRVLNIAVKEAFLSYISQLERVSGIVINTFANLLQALESRINYFHEHGCRIADHGLTQIPSQFNFTTALENEFADFVQNKNAHFSQPECFTGALLLALCRMYNAKEWVQQFHLGALRNNNTRLLKLLGADAGVDSIGDFLQAEALSRFLDALETDNKLPKTILYNLNPADNELFATMCSNFNDGNIKGKIQYGSGWWFLDQKGGIEKQLNAFSNMSVISTFIGMITDSRSFLSYSRHEYFRRILCNLFGREMENGELPDDEKWMGSIIQNICYYNAKNYFNF